MSQESIQEIVDELVDYVLALPAGVDMGKSWSNQSDDCARAAEAVAVAWQGTKHEHGYSIDKEACVRAAMEAAKAFAALAIQFRTIPRGVI